MFVVYCPAHRAAVLLPSSRIRGTHSSPGRRGVDVDWRCWCGHLGRSTVGRSVGPVGLPAAS